MSGRCLLYLGVDGHAQAVGIASMTWPAIMLKPCLAR